MPTPDPDQVYSYWHRWPDANIYVPLGAQSNLLVLRVCRDEGFGNFLDLIPDDDPAYDTATVDTAWGWDLYFRCRPEQATLAGEVAPGVSLVGEGSYGILPPSRTPNGEFYTWLDLDAEVLLLPDSLIQLVPVRPAAKVSVWVPDKIESPVLIRSDKTGGDPDAH